MQDWKIVNSSKYSLSCCTYVFHRCRFVLAFFVLAFSTLAYSYLRIPYLHIPSSGTFVFRTCVFSRPVQSSALPVQQFKIDALISRVLTTLTKLCSGWQSHQSAVLPHKKQSCFQSKVSTFVRRCLTAGSSLLAVFPRWCCSYRLLLVNSSTIRMYCYNTWFTFQVLIKFNISAQIWEVMQGIKTFPC